MQGLDNDQDILQSDPPFRQTGRHMTTYTVTVKTYDLKSDHESLKVARHQDKVADGQSVAKRLGLGLRLQRVNKLQFYVIKMPVYTLHVLLVGTESNG
jgi:hypothetical protein